MKNRRESRLKDGDDRVITIYVNDEAFEKAQHNFSELERIAKRECSLAIGGGYINVYTRDEGTIEDVVAWLGEENVEEVADG